jgi:tetratricopeptide (TPR) repeat protein
LTLADDTLSVHRLVQAVARDRISEKERKIWSEAAVRLLSGAFPYDSHDIRTWPACSLMMPHGLAAVGHAEGFKVDPEAASKLIKKIGNYLYGRAEFNEAKSAYERALIIDENIYGPDHPNVAWVINNLGMVLKEMGELEGSKKHFERALEIDPPNVAIYINNLGWILRAQGNLKGAKVHFEMALEIDENIYGPNHPNVARDVNNLGMVLNDMGDLLGAKKHFERALEIDKKDCGPNHPKIAIYENNLGSVLRHMGTIELVSDVGRAHSIT